ncbi:hypothetical protein AK812_SmicGene39418 [Symbiodinium microadriaticum]|uniref:Reverse transcriptase domain-containing protein n=1 Tax=Symbiodinium microadriaticum TaxID=2951 RepID=A0A1Q9CBA7_SYMMI|nr:hypothetical protein AK812_SmicGene39418 [Symbiodinium microadriaticum]CAE7274006.1 unnamed protein product [Symbiodinium sp. KB8]
MALPTHQKGIEGPEALEELLASLQVPDPLCNALKGTGIQSIPDIAFACNEVSDLSRFCDASTYAQLWQDLGIDEPEHSPAMARLRRAWHRCKALAQAAELPTSPAETSTAQQLPLNSWAEHAPPRLDAATIAQLTKDFQANYPGEHLDGDAMPSVRLLSIVHKWFSPGGSIAWIPWQLRLSQKQYQEIIESKSTKTLRTEAQFLSTALYDETPELPVDHLRLSPAWLGRIQTVFRNAIALCKGAHLARLKAFDKKVLDLAMHSPADAWKLRHCTAQDGKGKDGKGNGKGKTSTQPGKRKEPGTGAAVIVKWAGDRCRDGTLATASPALEKQSNAETEPEAHAPMKEAAKDILAYLRQHNLVHSIAQHLREHKETEPLSEHHGAVIAEIIRRKVDPECSTEHCLAISPGQPFRLNLLHSIALAIQDKDAQLPTILEQGVPTGAFDPLPSSKQWPQAPHSIDASSDLQGPHLEHCRGNWTMAEQSPELLAQLIQQEVDKGFVKRFEGTEEDAALRWPKGTAIGKLNVVLAEGRDPRLVLDSTVCGLNPAVHIPERVALPTASDVQRTFLAEDCYAQQTALSIDLKAAHKCNKVHPAEQGTLLFRQGTALYYYTVCHFGARFSAYWWQRTGGLILRCMHALLGRYPHKAWLYVDDLLCMLRTAQSEQCAALIVALLAALHAPISWKKAQFSTSVTWCGWTFCTATETVELVPAKLRKLREQLQALQRKSKILRKELEAVLGLLNWATSISKHLRPFMAPLYKDLHSGQGTLHSIAPSAWQAFYDCLDSAGQLSRTPPGSWLPRNGRVLEVGSLKISCKADVPIVPPSHKHSWVRIFDPHRGEIHLRQESKFVLEWLRHCFAHEQPRSLRAAPLLHCLSAADAFADKHRMGIGGWLATSKRYFWYSEIFTGEQVRQQWPQLSGSLQPYIGCFEALAQLALAQCVWQALRSKHVRFVLPSASDNTSAESGLNKLFSTAEPLGTFLRLAATWAHLHRVQFQVEHLAGEKNTWADKLSRGSIDFMQRRSADRVRITLPQLASASHSVSLHGTATHWPDTLVRAQHEMLK